MDLHITFQGVVFISSILGHMLFTVWYASKVVAKIGSLSESLMRIDKELEKRDVQIQKLWERIDEVRELIK